MLDYIYKLDLNQTPQFLINTLANSIAELLKIFYGRPEKKPEQYLEKILNVILQANTQEIYYVSLIIFDYILKNIQIDCGQFYFFEFKTM